jgi:hypothetical protein
VTQMMKQCDGCNELYTSAECPRCRGTKHLRVCECGSPDLFRSCSTCGDVLGKGKCIAHAHAPVVRHCRDCNAEIDEKTCTICSELKPTSEYYKRTDGGLYPECKSCHKVKSLGYQSERRAERRKKAKLKRDAEDGAIRFMGEEDTYRTVRVYKPGMDMPFHEYQVPQQNNKFISAMMALQLQYQITDKGIRLGPYTQAYVEDRNAVLDAALSKWRGTSEA